MLILVTFAVIGVAITGGTLFGWWARRRTERIAERPAVNSPELLELREIARYAQRLVGLHGDLIALSTKRYEAVLPLLTEIRDRLGAYPDPEMAKTAQALAEHVNSLDKSCLALTQVLQEALPGLTRIGDSAFLIGKGARDMNDNITALRAVVFGGRRAEEFPITTNDDAGIRRANMESEIADLMADHNLSRRDAEARVKDMYARIGR